ncbi:MAG: DUF4358 domain-containing protein [Lachnospiraceae bacterium]|nr:DUF4358 domain-containing protein [Lachnospiraceae bacterium]
MKKAYKKIIIPGMILSLLVLGACQKNEASAPLGSETSVVEENKIEAAGETTAATEASKEETKEEAVAEPTEAPKEETAAEPTETPKEETEDVSKESDNGDTAKTGSDDAPVAEETKVVENEKAAVALKDVYNKIAGSVALPEMYFADAAFMLNYYGIDASKLEDYVFASCLDSTSADSIILIRLKDEASADEVVSGLNMLLEQMSIELENYNPEANELVKAAKVRRNGKNIDLIIHKDRDAILSIINSSL